MTASASFRVGNVRRNPQVRQWTYAIPEPPRSSMPRPTGGCRLGRKVKLRHYPPPPIPLDGILRRAQGFATNRSDRATHPNAMRLRAEGPRAVPGGVRRGDGISRNTVVTYETRPDPLHSSARPDRARRWGDGGLTFAWYGRGADPLGAA